MKPNFDTHAAYVSLINVGFDDKKATQLLETLKDSQADLATKQDIEGLRASTKQDVLDVKTELKADMKLMSMQTKGLYAMNAITLGWLGWMTAILLEILKNLPK